MANLPDIEQDTSKLNLLKNPFSLASNVEQGSLDKLEEVEEDGVERSQDDSKETDSFCIDMDDT